MSAEKCWRFSNESVAFWVIGKPQIFSLILENTYPYLASLPLLFLYLLLGEKTFFSPSPRSMSICTGDWLIEFLLNIFVSFLPAGTLMHTRLLLCPVQMRRPTHPVGGLGENFSPWANYYSSASLWAPFPGLEWWNQFLLRRLSLEDYF